MVAYERSEHALGKYRAGFCGLVHLKIGMFKGETWGTLIRYRSDLGHPPCVGRTKERATIEPDFVVVPPCPTAGQDGAPSSVVGVEIAKARVGHPPMAKVGHPPDGGKRQLCLGESGDMIVVA